MILFAPKKKEVKPLNRPRRTIKLCTEFREIFGFYPPLDRFMMAVTNEFELDVLKLDEILLDKGQNSPVAEYPIGGARTPQVTDETACPAPGFNKDYILFKYGKKAVEHLERWLV